MIARRIAFLSLVGSIALGGCSGLLSDVTPTPTWRSATLTPAAATAAPTMDAALAAPPDECSLAEERALALLEEVYAGMPPPPQGAEMLVQRRGGDCTTGRYSHVTVYGINGEHPLQVLPKYYWDPLSDRGWESAAAWRQTPG